MQSSSTFGSWPCGAKSNAGCSLTSRTCCPTTMEHLPAISRHSKKNSPSMASPKHSPMPQHWSPKTGPTPKIPRTACSPQWPDCPTHPSRDSKAETSSSVPRSIVQSATVKVAEATEASWTTSRRTPKRNRATTHQDCVTPGTTSSDHATSRQASTVEDDGRLMSSGVSPSVSRPHPWPASPPTCSKKIAGIS